MIDKIMRSGAASTNHWKEILFHNVSNMQGINGDQHKAVFLGINWNMKREKNPTFSNTNLKFWPAAKATAITDISSTANRRFRESKKRKRKEKEEKG